VTLDREKDRSEADESSLVGVGTELQQMTRLSEIVVDERRDEASAE